MLFTVRPIILDTLSVHNEFMPACQRRDSVNNTAFFLSLRIEVLRTNLDSPFLHLRLNQRSYYTMTHIRFYTNEVNLVLYSNIQNTINVLFCHTAFEPACTKHMHIRVHSTAYTERHFITP